MALRLRSADGRAAFLGESNSGALQAAFPTTLSTSATGPGQRSRTSTGAGGLGRALAPELFGREAELAALGEANPPFANDQLERARFVPSILREFDVSVVQELNDNPSRRRIINFIRELLPHRTAVAGRTSAKKANAGVVVISKFPIRKTAVKLFGDVSMGADSRANKAVRHVCIEKQGFRYHPALAIGGGLPPFVVGIYGHYAFGLDRCNEIPEAT